MNSFDTLLNLEISGKKFHYHSLKKLEKNTGYAVSQLPYCTRILIENLLRHEDGEAIQKKDIEAILNQKLTDESKDEIQFTPSRVLLQDFTGVPVVPGVVERAP